MAGERSDGVRRRRGVLAAAGLVLVALTPVIVVIATRAGRHYLLVQDFAVIDLGVRDVFSRDVPLVGPYSRYGWDHPGPLVYWLVAPFSAVFGRPAWATQVGFALLQGGAGIWLGIVSWRRRGLWAVAFWLAVLCLGVATVGPAILLQPWGPNVTLPFFVLFCCLVWLVRDDDTAAVVQATLVGSFLVQTHLGYAPLVLGGAGLILVVLRRAAGSWSAFIRLRSARPDPPHAPARLRNGSCAPRRGVTPVPGRAPGGERMDKGPSRAGPGPPRPR